MELREGRTEMSTGLQAFQHHTQASCHLPCIADLSRHLQPPCAHLVQPLWSHLLQTLWSHLLQTLLCTPTVATSPMHTSYHTYCSSPWSQLLQPPPPCTPIATPPWSHLLQFPRAHLLLPSVLAMDSMARCCVEQRWRSLLGPSSASASPKAREAVGVGEGSWDWLPPFCLHA